MFGLPVSAACAATGSLGTYSKPSAFMQAAIAFSTFACAAAIPLRVKPSSSSMPASDCASAGGGVARRRLRDVAAVVAAAGRERQERAAPPARP